MPKMNTALTATTYWTSRNTRICSTASFNQAETPARVSPEDDLSGLMMAGQKGKVEMKRNDYWKSLREAWEAGRISDEAYDAGMANADVFCDEDEDEEE